MRVGENMDFQYISKMLHEILTVAEQGLCQTIKIFWKKRFASVIIYSRYALDSLDLMKTTANSSQHSLGYKILSDAAKMNFISNVKEILAISENSHRTGIKITGGDSVAYVIEQGG